MIKYTVLCNNYTEKRNILCEHGLSILVETEEEKILFDTGASDVFLQNAVNLDLELKDVHFVVLSHGHFDHTGGYPAFYALSPDTKVYLSPNSFSLRYNAKDKNPAKKPIGIPWKEEKSMYEKNLVYVTEPTTLSDNVFLSGEVPRKETLSLGQANFVIKTDSGDILPDPIQDEIFLILKGKKGLHLIWGCSHFQIENGLDAVHRLFPHEKIVSLTGGFHFMHSAKEEIQKVIDLFKQENMEALYPIHCTGQIAGAMMAEQLSCKVALLSAGEEVLLEP